MKVSGYQIKISYADGSQDCAALTPGRWAQVGNVQALLKQEGEILCPVLRLTEGTQAAPLDAQIVIRLPADIFNDNLAFYNNGFATNEITNIHRWKDHRGDAMHDVLVMQNGNEEFGFGNVTALRFYTELRFGENALVEYVDLENKPLPAEQELALEKLLIAKDGEKAEDFLSRWADVAAKQMQADPLTITPIGWCSWSCYYSNVDEEKLLRVAREVPAVLGKKSANLVQIDDGWQESDNFPGRYTVDLNKFPNGLEPVADAVHEKGMQFGLWLSPLLLCEHSVFYSELKKWAREDVTLRANADCHPFDLENEEYLAYLTESFARLTEKYHVEYYKLDFLMASYRSFIEDFGRRVYGKTDYIIALLRRAFAAIRAGVGPDVTLLACGAPVLECAGIFNAARMACDIIWGTEEDNSTPSTWTLTQWVSRTVLYRNFYHKKLFLNDPDGLVIRDWNNGDGFDCTWSEAKLWATALAFSGGSVLVNEEVERLGLQRKQLFARLVPPLEIAARPLHFFEEPAPTQAILNYSEDIVFAASFHWGDAREKRTLRTADYGMEKALVIRCWDGAVLGVTDTVEEKKCQPHSAEMYMLRKVPEKPCFLFSDVNVWGGVGHYSAGLGENGWSLQADGQVDGLPANVYAWLPECCKEQGMDENVQLIAELPGGKLVQLQKGGANPLVPVMK